VSAARIKINIMALPMMTEGSWRSLKIILDFMRLSVIADLWVDYCVKNIDLDVCISMFILHPINTVLLHAILLQDLLKVTACSNRSFGLFL
jgi:hypothetical protein